MTYDDLQLDEIMELEGLATSVSVADFLVRDLKDIAGLSSSEFVDAHNQYAESVRKSTKNQGYLGADF